MSGVVLLLVGVGLIYFEFYNTTKSNISKLLKDDIRNNSLDIKHFLNSELKVSNIDTLKSHLDSVVSSNNLIKNLQIINSNNQIIYSTNRKNEMLRSKCLSISKISKEIVLDTKCYSFSITLYDGLEPYYYSSNIVINKNYIDKLLDENMIRIITYFLLFSIIFISIFWHFLKEIIIIPLEKLRQYAYYSNQTPKEFFINEIESIRYSLSMTFARLKKEQEELYNLSTRDKLSGLYNRMSLMEKIEWIISNSERTDKKFAIIFLDLDNFKNINDSMGHDFGDKILVEVSKILLKSVRDNDIVSRLGGDEFVVVLSQNIEDETKIVEVLDRIKKYLSIPVTFNDYKYYLTASMGVSIYPRDGKDVITLLKNADIAMYKAKNLGKNNYHFFTDSLDAEIQKKVAVQKLLIEGLENGYFELYYQPKVDVKTNKITACEALIRLNDPNRGLIPPNDFITIAEENNFILKLGDWIIKEAAKQLKEWENTIFKDIKISINVSAKQFQDEYLVQKIDIYTSNINRSLLDLELTESVFINDFDKNNEIITKLKKLGFTLSLDDFGTGYSSLSYLKKIPFDTIKIDKTFIDDIEYEDGRNFADMIINIAKSLDMEIVAEGVENKGQLSYLKTINCDTYQGYLCSRPLKIKSFEKLVEENN
jgi:diguanylate cyclase (GGDEF)-like protein